MTILVSNEGVVRTITINRSERRNAVDPDTALPCEPPYVLE